MKKLSLKYLKQKEKRIRDAMKFFLRASPSQPDIASIRLKVILVCKALIKVVGHAELLQMRPEYPYLNELDAICNRMIVKFENNTEDGVQQEEPEESKKETGENVPRKGGRPPKKGKKSARQMALTINNNCRDEKKRTLKAEAKSSKHLSSDNTLILARGTKRQAVIKAAVMKAAEEAAERSRKDSVKKVRPKRQENNEEESESEEDEEEDDEEGTESEDEEQSENPLAFPNSPGKRGRKKGRGKGKKGIASN